MPDGGGCVEYGAGVEATERVGRTVMGGEEGARRENGAGR